MQDTVQSAQQQQHRSWSESKPAVLDRLQHMRASSLNALESADVHRTAAADVAHGEVDAHNRRRKHNAIMRLVKARHREMVRHTCASTQRHHQDAIPVRTARRT
jgi:hypothetical protein